MHKLQGQSTTSQKKARSTLPEVEPFVNDLDWPRNEDGEEVAEKVGCVEQGIEGLRVGPDQGPDHVKVDWFGALLSHERVQHTVFHGQAASRPRQDAIDPSLKQA